MITNREAARLRQVVEAARPDVLLAMETNAWWVRALQPLRARYPYRIELPREDSYGMVLYSRLPLTNTRVQDLAAARRAFHPHYAAPAGGRAVLFYGVHPTPPIPSDKYPDGVGRRSIALEQVAAFVRQRPQPAIVAGDFNDVPWSGTTHKLSRGGTLLDTRRGRGFYATFDANSRLMRWPLDQFFVTPQFRVVSLQRLPDVGSDHFPIVAEFPCPRRTEWAAGEGFRSGYLLNEKAGLSVGRSRRRAR
ncbi:MAG: endonuclease/exonuclease/phosphatase family protein [Hymenobacter sp.]